MKKLIYSLCLLTALPLAAQKKTFTAACLNVDGLPPSVKAAGVVNVKLNPEGPQSAGTKTISKLVANKNWDFFGVSENFNYNDELMSELKGNYNAGTYRGKIPSSVTNVVPYLNGSKWFDTDGLNLLWKSTVSVSDEAWYLWNARNGITNDGADQLIAKGYRYYCVTVAPGMEIDVYIHHMDAETTEKDNAAREVQMKQLVDKILASDNKRPILIMGDSNCRYTRDKIQEIMFGRINADDRFEMHDPWIDFARKGVYPQVGDNSIMVPGKFDGTNHDAYQTGEVVDKVFYINNTDASCKLTALNYLQDTDFTDPDTGLGVSDHFPIVIKFEIEKTKEALTGGEYYIQNVATGKFMAAGANWGTRGIVATTGNRMTLQPDGDKFILKSTLNYLGDNLYMDNDTPQSYTFNYDSERGVYNILLGTNAVYADNDNLLQFGTLNSADESYQWKLVTLQELLEVLRSQASATNPIDATFMIRGANFSRNDNENSNGWTKEQGNYLTTVNIGGGGLSENDLTSSNYVCEFFNNKYTSAVGRTSAGSISQTISNLPNGKYKIEFQGFTRNGNNNFYVSINEKTINLDDLSVYGQDTKIHDNTVQTNGKWVPNGMAGAAAYFNKGYYKKSYEFDISNNSLSIIVNKPSTTSETWMCFDNFVLTYYGPTEESLAAFDRVKAAIDDAQDKADKMNLTGYSNKAVEEAWANRLVQGDGSKEIERTYTSLANAALKQTNIPADLTYAIINNSFEIYPDYKNSSYNIDGGYPLGWTYPSEYKQDSGVWHKDNNDKSTSNGDGDYLYNSWAWGASESEASANTIYQSLTLTPGIYTLKAKVASHAGNKVYIYAGDNYAGVTTTGKEVFVPVELRFQVPERSSMKIGVTGGAISDNSFTTPNGHFYKADDFHLTRIADAEAAIGYELIKKAIADATTRINAMGTPYNDGWTDKMKKYQDIVDNFTLEGTGEKEFYEIYALLREMVYSQPKTSGKYFTNAIINNSFEFGDSYGWNVNFTGDTGVKPNSDGTYTIKPADGNYVFNTWNNGRGTIITQTIPNLPAGKWKLMAKAAADKDKYVYMEVIGQEGFESQKDKFQMKNDKGTSQEIELIFNVAENTPEITIAFGGCNADGSYDSFGGEWYKIDDIRLQYVGDADVCFFYQRLKKAIEETSEVASALDKKYSDQWDASSYQALVDAHMTSYHGENASHDNDDPLNGSGIDEINELYRKMRELVFSQTESGADMTGAIMNNSFELGDISGWTCNLIDGEVKVTAAENNDPYTTAGADEELLFNCYSGNTAKPIYQTIPDVPAGRYKLSAKIASDAGNKFYLGANDKHNEEPFVTTDKTTFQTVEFEFEVKVEDVSKDVTIGLYPAINGDAADWSRDDYPLNLGPWYKVDDFRLTLLSRYREIDWTPEFADCGTIMLPFAVDKETMKTLPYSAYSIDRLVKNETPADIDRNLYRIIHLTDPVSEIEANKPYLMIKDGAAVVSPVSMKAVATQAEEAPKPVTFKGWTENTQDQVIGDYQIMEGSLTAHQPNKIHYHLQKDELGNIGFILHDATDENASEEDARMIEEYHAYIVREISAEGFAETDNLLMEGFYFKEPMQEWTIELEEGKYGTVVLPFYADLPEGLEARQLTGVSEERNALGYTYQVAKLSEPVSSLEANVPYVVSSTINDEDVDPDIFTFHGVATNTAEEYSPEGNLLTGLFKSRDGVKYNDEKKRKPLEAGHWVLMHDENGTAAFVKTTEPTALGAYNAYIFNKDFTPITDEEYEYTPGTPTEEDQASAKSLKLLAEETETAAAPSADVIYLTEAHASTTYEWTMETVDYGTLILPFDHAVPEGLEAYEIKLADEEAKEWPEATDDATYQLLAPTKAETLEANKAYLMVKAGAIGSKAESEDYTPDASKMTYEFTGAPDADTDPAMNGILMGTFNEEEISTVGAYLAMDDLDTNKPRQFQRIESENQGGKVEALHAYVPETAVPSATATYLVLVAPGSDGDVHVGIEEIFAGEENVDIYTLNGVLVRRDVKATEALQELDRGIYILHSAKGSVKVVK